MARKKAEVVELEEVEEVETETTEDTLSAKQAAAMLKTDGRTLRKFLRSKFGTVGQGARWAIDPDDIETLRAEFETWASGAKKKSKADKSKPKGKVPDQDTIDELEEVDNDELEEIEDIDDLLEDLDDIEEIE